MKTLRWKRKSRMQRSAYWSNFWCSCSCLSAAAAPVSKRMLKQGDVCLLSPTILCLCWCWWLCLCHHLPRHPPRSLSKVETDSSVQPLRRLQYAHWEGWGAQGRARLQPAEATWQELLFMLDTLAVVQSFPPCAPEDPRKKKAQHLQVIWQPILTDCRHGQQEARSLMNEQLQQLHVSASSAAAACQHGILAGAAELTQLQISHDLR